ncbi:MAG: cytochrome c3 family protein [Sedimentisphaerales bacterium]
MAKALLLVVVLMTGIAVGAKPDGDTPDGSRSNFVHLIPLLSEPVAGKEPDQIHSDADPVLPFSTKQTCGACHSYDKIGAGWHFNAIDPNVNPGRKGQPWIFADPTSATQIPLSYRQWPGTFRPEQIGLTPMAFLESFGRQMPGGGIGEMVDKSENPEETLRSDVTGKLEINCLACHDGSPGIDMGGASGYSINVIRGNYRWAATASCEFAYVTRSMGKLPIEYDFRASYVSADPKVKPPAVEYRKQAFGHNDWVDFDIRREPPKQRCYFCHSNVDVRDGKTEKWISDEDVHLAAGLICADCHRNGLDHNITRGYAVESRDSNNPLTTVSSCEGCHLGKNGEKPVAGRFAAPTPKHTGIPPSHFDKLSCTACHSGPWPTNDTIRTKTARAHALGIAGASKEGEILPHLLYPVFAKGQDGKIGVFKLLWPAYWATMSDGNVITPLAMETVKSVTSRVITKTAFSKTGSWPDLKDEDIVKILTLLGSKVDAGAKPVYITGGKLYSVDEGGKLVPADNKMAEPYLWPIAHDIRPAAQSLGVRNCQDCHTTNSPFLFGLVSIDSPLKNITGREMVAFEDLPRFYTKAFAFSFVFRPWLKVVAILSSLVILGVLVLYALKALGFVAKVVVGDE